MDIHGPSVPSTRLGAAAPSTSNVEQNPLVSPFHSTRENRAGETNGASNGVGGTAAGMSTKDKLLGLMKEKDGLEGELKALGQVLDSHGVTMNTPLTTFDGYPRDDIDVPQIRITRSRIIHLRNDYKGLMSQIENLLHKYHAEIRAASPPRNQQEQEETTTAETTTATETPTQQTISQAQALAPAPPLPLAPTQSPTQNQNQAQAPPPPLPFDLPFALIDQIFPLSPAETAGLKVGDLLIRFGDVHALNHNKLAKVAEVVGASEGVPIVVLVQRRDGGEGAAVGSEEGGQEGGEGERGEMEIVRVTLVPRSGWGGRGLMGCHLRPL